MTIEIENAWIAAEDGVRLAISLWRPDGHAPVPVVLEAIPYRKRDSTRGYARSWGRKLAERGIAYLRLDARGSDDSGGPRLRGDERHGGKLSTDADALDLTAPPRPSAH